MRRRRAEDGSAVVDFVITLPLLVLAAVLGVQVFLFFAAVTAAEHAALEGARAHSEGRNGRRVAYEAVMPLLREGTRVSDGCDSVTVRIAVPVVATGRTSERWVADATAAIPPRTPSGLLSGLVGCF